MINGAAEEYELPERCAENTSFTTWWCTPCKQCKCKCKCSIPTLRELWENDRRLLRAIATIIIVMNLPYGRYILYPFLLFSTWIHESCHGVAALVVGGKVEWLNVYSNGSGLAHTIIPDTRLHRVFVSSAGYTGTAILGGILLMFRRTRLGPRVGLCSLGTLLLLSCACLVRNAFGLASLLSIGTILILCGWYLSSFWAGDLYALLAATTCSNAITSIQVLFGTTSQDIGGQVRYSDAMSVAEQLLLPYWVWALLWLLLALCMTVAGLVFVVENTPSNDDQVYGDTDSNDCERLKPASTVEII